MARAFVFKVFAKSTIAGIDNQTVNFRKKRRRLRMKQWRFRSHAASLVPKVGGSQVLEATAAPTVDVVVDAEDVAVTQA